MLWVIAPIIVKTNQERITLNYICVLQFARKTNTFLVRWEADISQWEGKPTDNQLHEVIEKDPAFLEIFIYGAPCSLSYTISKKRKLYKRKRAKYQKIILQDEVA